MLQSSSNLETNENDSQMELKQLQNRKKMKFLENITENGRGESFSTRHVKDKCMHSTCVFKPIKGLCWKK